MRPSALLIAIVFSLTLLVFPVSAEEKSEDYDEETVDWLKSWGIRRNTDGSLQSMSPAELEEYWRSREIQESERQERRHKLENLMKEQVEHDQEMIRKNPNDPDVHYQISINHENRGDPEGAIIHMIQAEQMYKVQKNLRGLARSRKALREFFETYGYLPEDFDLSH